MRIAGALLASDTLVPPVPAPFEIVTVQFVEPAEERLAVAHCRELIVVASDTVNPVETLELPTVAVSVTLWSAVTAAAVAVNVAPVAPAATVTVDGTVTAVGALLVRVTVAPPLGAAVASVTVQVVAAEGASTEDAHCMPEIEIGARIVNAWDLLDPATDAVRVALWSDVTTPPVAVKVAVADPEVTVTAAGTIRIAGALLARDTLTPPLAAGLEIVTVQFVEPADVKLVFVHCSDVIVVATDTVSPVETFALPTVAVKVTLWSEVTVAAVAVNVALVAPGATVAVAGTVRAEGALLVKVTEVPAPEAAVVRVTVQVVVAEGASTEDAHCSPESDIGA